MNRTEQMLCFFDAVRPTWVDSAKCIVYGYKLLQDRINAAQQVPETSQNQAELAQALNKLFHRFKIS